MIHRYALYCQAPEVQVSSVQMLAKNSTNDVSKTVGVCDSCDMKGGREGHVVQNVEASLHFAPRPHIGPIAQPQNQPSTARLTAGMVGDVDSRANPQKMQS